MAIEREYIPSFSVIIPTYNRASSVTNAINSVLDQSFQNWECIVVDDGSTDNTREVVTTLAQKDKRVKYVYQDNAERSAARNNGINLASGEYICFLDSDDQYDPNYLNAIFEELKQSEFDLGITAQRIIGSGIKSIIEPEDVTYDINYFFRHSVVPGRLCIQRSFLGDTRFQEHIRISEDTYFLCELALKKPIIKLIPKAELIYHEHTDNSVNFKKYNAYQDRYNTLKEIAQDLTFRDKFDNTVVWKTLNDCYFGVFKFYYFNGKIALARHSMIKAIAQLPSYRFKEKLYLLIYAHKKNLFDQS